MDYLSKHYVWDAALTAEMHFSQFWRLDIWDLESTPLPLVKTFGFHAISSMKYLARRYWLLMPTVSGVAWIHCPYPSGLLHYILEYIGSTKWIQSGFVIVVWFLYLSFILSLLLILKHISWKKDILGRSWRSCRYIRYDWVILYTFMNFSKNKFRLFSKNK